jgi:hypothetical protein
MGGRVVWVVYGQAGLDSFEEMQWHGPRPGSHIDGRIPLMGLGVGLWAGHEDGRGYAVVCLLFWLGAYRLY